MVIFFQSINSLITYIFNLKHSAVENSPDTINYQAEIEENQLPEDLTFDNVEMLDEVFERDNQLDVQKNDCEVPVEEKDSILKTAKNIYEEALEDNLQGNIFLF